MSTLSDNPDQFLTAIKTVAFKAETFGECHQLMQWFLANIPYIEKGEPNDLLFFALDNLVHYWSTYGCAEDELFPALAILYTYAAHGHLDRSGLDAIADKQSRCEWMINNPNMEEDIPTYEEFCDKYAADLN